MLSLPNLRWGRREDTSTSRRGGEGRAGREGSLLSEGRAGAGEADRQGVSYRPIPVRQRQECQLCGQHCQVAQEGGGAVASPPRPPIRGKRDLAGRAVLGAGVSRGCRLTRAAEGDEEEKEVRGQEGGVRRNWKLQWEESVRWPRAKFLVVSVLWGAQ